MVADAIERFDAQMLGVVGGRPSPRAAPRAPADDPDPRPPHPNRPPFHAVAPSSCTSAHVINLDDAMSPVRRVEVGDRGADPPPGRGAPTSPPPTFPQSRTPSLLDACDDDTILNPYDPLEAADGDEPSASPHLPSPWPSLLDLKELDAAPQLLLDAEDVKAERAPAPAPAPQRRARALHVAPAPAPPPPPPPPRSPPAAATAARAAAMNRWRAKKAARASAPRRAGSAVQYPRRKAAALARPRVGGRFLSRAEAAALVASGGGRR